MFTTPARQGTRPRMAARNAGARFRPAGVLASLAVAVLASSALSSAAFAAHTPGGASAFLSGGGDDIAFQANTKFLWTTSGPGTGQSLELGMKAGTSPAITALPGGGYEVAFQANTGHLWVVQNVPAQDLDLGMMTGTSPASPPCPAAGMRSRSRPTPATCGSSERRRPGPGPGHEDGTSPAITALPGGGYEVAFQANTGHLWPSSATAAARTWAWA